MIKNKDREYYIYLELPGYIQDWIVNYCGGSVPVHFRKNSIESICLRVGLVKLPSNMNPELPTPGSLAVAIPDFKEKPPRVYNYLPRAAKFKLIKCLKQNFRLHLWYSLHKFGWIGKQRIRLIEDYMSQHGIEDSETNTRTILKIYQRAYKDFLKNRKEVI